MADLEQGIPTSGIPAMGIPRPYSEVSPAQITLRSALLREEVETRKLEETKHGLFRDCFLGAPE